MITSNIYGRVFQLKVGDSTGTIFVIEHDERQYWVTAKHVIDDWDGSSPLQIMRSDGWKTISLSLLAKHETADVAILAADFHAAFHQADATMKHLAITQEVFFLGFPYGWAAQVPAHVNREFPMPFVKKALVSAICPMDDGGREMLILDGHNNPGFSGGPVVYDDKWEPGQPLRIAGVVSGYRFAPESVFGRGGPVDAYVKANTGLMLCETIKRVLDLIELFPHGAPCPHQ